jgi:hypothetical protein
MKVPNIIALFDPVCQPLLLVLTRTVDNLQPPRLVANDPVGFPRLLSLLQDPNEAKKI